MALTLETIKLEGVNIDGKNYTPSSVTMERRMRIAKISADGTFGNPEMLDNIAECFGDDKDEIREKLERLPITAIAEIQLYIMDGENAVQKLREKQSENQRQS